MLKRKTKNNNQRKSQLFIVGSFLIIVGVGILGGKIVNNYLDKKQEQDLINDFYEQQEEYVVDVPVMEEELVKEEVAEQAEKKETTTSNKYRCVICGHIYDDEVEKIKFEDLPDDWKCPVCGVSKDKFEKIN